jgi:hypothetical protein
MTWVSGVPCWVINDVELVVDSSIMPCNLIAIHVVIMLCDDCLRTGRDVASDILYFTPGILVNYSVQYRHQMAYMLTVRLREDGEQCFVKGTFRFTVFGYKHHKLCNNNANQTTITTALALPNRSRA